MRVGIDFDNTLVCYDAIFHKLAVESSYIPETVPPRKQAVRDRMRQAGLEGCWTELQGAVYGDAIQGAAAYPSALAVIERLHAAGAALFIISHKTRMPFRGPPHDLHAAAFGWLEASGFLDKGRTGLGRDRIYFEPTKEAKLARIAACHCTHFIDDLPEFLAEPGFPKPTARIWFNPDRLPTTGTGATSAASWQIIGDVLLGRKAACP